MAAKAEVKKPETKKEGIEPEGFHARSKIQQVDLSEVKIDRSYQRDVSMTLVDDIVENWDEVASELVLYSNRGERKNATESGIFIINGQHRTAAARKLGMKKIWARLVDLSDLDDPGSVEAELRLKTNKRLGDRPMERFKAQLRAGNEESLAIRDLLARFDTEINLSPNMDSGLNTVAGIEQLYRVDDGVLLERTLELIKSAWGKIGGEGFNVSLLKGVAWFIERHEIEADMKRFTERIKTTGPGALANRARTVQATMGGALWMNYYRALVESYNDRLSERTRLEWKLRGSTAIGKSS